MSCRLPSALTSALNSLRALPRRVVAHARQLVRRIGGGAYLVLAAVFSLLIVADTGVLNLVAAAETRLFDMLITKRIVVPRADPDIVIIDIDEASLAGMAKEHGRWPWPNSVLGDLVTGIEQQQPRAIVFDILFSDRDTLRPQSDEAFNTVIAGSTTTFFPMLRLDPKNDHLSRITPGMLPGVTKLGTSASDNGKDTTIAIILPKVTAAIDNGRLGTHQVVPDKDGVIRRYPAWLMHDGWRIPSLPQRIAEEFSYPGSRQQEVLLNWRGPPFTYHYAAFVDVYRDLQRDKKQRPAYEFTGKIVVIGSTAPSLFDVKGTPMARIHPGVEILATAIDNFKNDDWLRERPPWLMIAATLVLIWSMSFALYRQVRIDIFDTVFAGLQGGLILAAFATLNLSHWYLDTSAPLSLGVIYFTVVRLYYGFSMQALANTRTDEIVDMSAGHRHIAVFAIELQDARPAERRRLKVELNRFVARSNLGAGRIAELVEDPGLVRGAFADVMLVYWLMEAADDAWMAEADTLTNTLQQGQAGRRWAQRLKFYRHGAVVDWTTPGGWKHAVRRTILLALGNASPLGAPDSKD